MSDADDRTLDHYGVLEELLRTPAFKDILREELVESTATRGSDYIEGLLFQDIDTTVSIASSIPRQLNRLILDLTALGHQLSKKSTPALTESVTESFIGDIDSEAMRRCWEVWSREITRVLDHNPQAKAKLEGSIVDLLSLCMATGINRLAQQLAQPRKESFASQLFSATWTKIDSVMLERASFQIVDSLLDSRLNIVQKTGRLLRHRVANR